MVGGVATKGEPVVKGRSKHLSLVVGLLLLAALGFSVPFGSVEAGRAAAAEAGRSRAVAVAELRHHLDEILRDHRLDGAQAAVVVREASSGEVLYARNARQRMLPGSNEKLLTAFAALEALGPGYRFGTSAFTDGIDADGRVQGHLYLKGAGDPTMLETGYEALAAKVAVAGVRVVEGGLVADDTWFDEVRLGHDWAWDDEPYAYAAPVSALTVAPDDDYDVSSVMVEVSPGGAPGEPARVGVLPRTDAVTVVNRAITAAAGSSQDLAVERAHGSSTIVVAGSVPQGAEPVRTPVSVWDPTAYAASVFLRALEEHGVSVNGPLSVGATSAGATELARVESPPLAEILVPMLKLSNNQQAEILVKTIGRRMRGAGSWEAGLQGASDVLPAVGLETTDLRSRDGSGLSRQSLVSPMQLTTLLLAARARSWYPVWYGALPVAGEADRLTGGTLRSRMKGTAAAGNVHAKTGTLTSVSALTGYVTGTGGAALVFSIMLNGYLGPAPKDIEDSIAVALASFGGPTGRDGTNARGAEGRRSVTRPPPASRPRILVRPGPSATLDASAVECSWIKAC